MPGRYGSRMHPAEGRAGACACRLTANPSATSAPSTTCIPAPAGSAGENGAPNPGCIAAQGAAPGMHPSLGTPNLQCPPPLLSLQQEPSEAPTPKRPRGRPKGSKNKATPKGRVGGWGRGRGRGLLWPHSRTLGPQVHFEPNYTQFRAELPLGGGVLGAGPRGRWGESQGQRVSPCGHPR